MGDLDSNISLASSSVSSKTKSCENIPSDAENGALLADPSTTTTASKSDSVTSVVFPGSPGDQQQTNQPSTTTTPQQHLTGVQMDAVLLQLEQGVEVALHRAKLWSKYAKDIMTYVEKRCNLEIEFAKNVAKLAQTMKSALKEEVMIHQFRHIWHMKIFLLVVVVVERIIYTRRYQFTPVWYAFCFLIVWQSFISKSPCT